MNVVQYFNARFLITDAHSLDRSSNMNEPLKICLLIVYVWIQLSHRKTAWLMQKTPLEWKHSMLSLFIAGSIDRICMKRK